MAELKVKSRKYNDADILEVENFGNDVVESLKGKDINVNGITSKGIANTGNIATTGKITGGEIIENMSGYSATLRTVEGLTLENVYCGIVKNGNKLTIVHAFNITKTDAELTSGWFAYYFLPSSIMSKLYPTQIGSYDWLAVQELHAFSNETSSVKVNIGLLKQEAQLTSFITTDNLVTNTKYYVRIEYTFLLSDSLITSGE